VVIEHECGRVSVFGLLGALACVLYLLYLVTAEATIQDVSGTLAVMKVAQEKVDEEAKRAAQEADSKAAQEQAILKEFDKNIRAIFPEPPLLGLSHFEVQQFLREKTNRN
jgi:hypothetical protein